MSGRAGGGSGEGGGEGQMSADEALAWQLQDKLFLQVFFFLRIVSFFASVGGGEGQSEC